MTSAEIDNRFCLDSLRGAICPACGKTKKPMRTLCFSDFSKLPVPMQQALYRPIGGGYREALIEALKFLKVDEPHHNTVQSKSRKTNDGANGDGAHTDGASDGRAAGTTPPPGLFTSGGKP